MQISPYVSHLSLYDIAGTPGVAADISHINSKAICKVSVLAQPVVAQRTVVSDDLCLPSTPDGH